MLLADVLYTVIDEATDPNLPDGNYSVYVVTVSSMFREDGVQIRENIFYTYYISGNTIHYETETWYSYPFPEQIYYIGQ